AQDVLRLAERAGAAPHRATADRRGDREEAETRPARLSRGCHRSPPDGHPTARPDRDPVNGYRSLQSLLVRTPSAWDSEDSYPPLVVRVQRAWLSGWRWFAGLSLYMLAMSGVIQLAGDDS